jgi:hypothetical protein
MTPDEVLRRRLANQGLARTAFRDPEDVVAWFGAVQAQDYLGALWALGLRMKSSTEALVETAEARRAIIRTWPMRGTLHFVTPADARWMTGLLGPRVIARNAARLERDFGVDAAVVARARAIVTRALADGNRLARPALYALLDARRIHTENSRGLHILGWLAVEGRICLAGREGKQHTFTLLDNWIPRTKPLGRDEALAELARRYFTSHGPATLKDFMWWAGITAKDAEAAIDGASPHLGHEIIEDRRYWFGTSAATRSMRSANASAPLVKLLPAYDEYTVAYQDRSWLLERAGSRGSAGFGLLNPSIVVDGRVVASWKRVIVKRTAEVQVNFNSRLSRVQQIALRNELAKYGKFLGLDAKLRTTSS